MTLQELFDIVSDFTKILILLPIDTGSGEVYDMEVTRGHRKGGCRKEYYDWLFSLGLEVNTVSVCAQDTCGNKELLCIHCKPKKWG